MAINAGAAVRLAGVGVKYGTTKTELPRTHLVVGRRRNPSIKVSCEMSAHASTTVAVRVDLKGKSGAGEKGKSESGRVAGAALERFSKGSRNLVFGVMRMAPARQD